MPTLHIVPRSSEELRRTVKGFSFIVIVDMVMQGFFSQVFRKVLSRTYRQNDLEQNFGELEQKFR